eukprot:scaffold10814_cov112-Isochrysis_galbana.AAC.6
MVEAPPAPATGLAIGTLHFTSPPLGDLLGCGRLRWLLVLRGVLPSTSSFAKPNKKRCKGSYLYMRSAVSVSSLVNSMRQQLPRGPPVPPHTPKPKQRAKQRKQAHKPHASMHMHMPHTHITSHAHQHTSQISTTNMPMPKQTQRTPARCRTENLKPATFTRAVRGAARPPPRDRSVERAGRARAGLSARVATTHRSPEPASSTARFSSSASVSAVVSSSTVVGLPLRGAFRAAPPLGDGKSRVGGLSCAPTNWCTRPMELLASCMSTRNEKWLPGTEISRIRGHHVFARLAKGISAEKALTSHAAASTTYVRRLVERVLRPKHQHRREQRFGALLPTVGVANERLHQRRQRLRDLDRADAGARGGHVGHGEARVALLVRLDRAPEWFPHHRQPAGAMNVDRVQQCERGWRAAVPLQHPGHLVRDDGAEREADDADHAFGLQRDNLLGNTMR